MVPFELFQSIGGALLALVGVVVVGWLAIVWIRRWMRSETDGSKPFSLEDLRRLHREGQLSDEEFQKARDAMISAVQRSTKPAPAAGAPAGRPSGPPLDPPVDFGLRPDTPPAEATRTHPTRSPKRPPQLGG